MKSETQNIEFKESWRDEYLKWLCGFANAQGGTLCVGIRDDGQIVGLKDVKRLMEDLPNKISATLGIMADVNFKENAGKPYLEIVAEPSMMPIVYHGAYYYRSGATLQELKGVALQQFLLKKIGMSWEDAPLSRAKMSDIDGEAVRFFQRAAVASNRMTPAAARLSVRKTLENLNLLTDDGALKNAAILLFGKNPGKFFPSCDFRIGRFVRSDSDLVFQDVIEGDLIRMADRVLATLKSKYLVSPIHYEGLQRIETLELPEDALREMIFNAIIHKDYTGVHIQMRVFNDRITIWNEGNLPTGLTIRQLLKEHSSRPRNRTIASVFYKAGFIENWGRGISKIVEEFKTAKLDVPQFAEDGDGVLVTVRRPYAVDADLTTERTTEKTTEKNRGGTAEQLQTKVIGLKNVQTSTTEKPDGETTEKTAAKILEILRREPLSTIAKISQEIGISVDGVNWNIREMKRIGRIKRIGGRKFGHWKVME